MHFDPAWWCRPLMAAFGRQRQTDLCKFKASLLNRVSFWIAKATQRSHVWKKKKKKSTSGMVATITPPTHPTPFSIFGKSTGQLQGA